MVEHGEYIVTVDKAIINVTFVGMFNDVASKNVCSEVEEIINEMNGAPFCMLFNLIDYQGSTPEAHVIGNQHFEWLEKQNCLAKANVISSMAFIEITRNAQPSLRQSTIETKIFEQKDDAKEWLLSLLSSL